MFKTQEMQIKMTQRFILHLTSQNGYHQENKQQMPQRMHVEKEPL
jgi:hypothetical protein